MLRLQVHAPGRNGPMTEIAYANRPLVNFEAIKNQVCPVKFWYHHPAATAATGTEFLQTPDGKLYCRVGRGGAYKPHGEVKPGDSIAVSADCQLSLLRYIPHARQEVVFSPSEPSPDDTTEAEAAALVELTTAGKSEQFWLRRNDAQLGVRKVQAAGEPLIVMFGYERYPLDFTVKLVELNRNPKPDSTGCASCASQVHVSGGTQDPDVASAAEPLREISTDRPLRCGTFTFYQAGFQQLPGKVDLSVLRVASDPGRLLEYSGAAMIGCGMLYMLFLRAFSRRRKPIPVPADATFMAHAALRRW